MNHPEEISIFGAKVTYNKKTRTWIGFYPHVDIRVEFKEVLARDLIGIDDDEVLIHCDVFHQNDLVAIGIGNDFYFAAVDAMLHKRIAAIIQMYKELSEIKNLTFNH